MKKLFLTVLAFVYLAVSSGISLNVHYCMGKFSSIDLSHNDKCSKCGMKTGFGRCCNDEFKIVKLSDSHNLSTCELNIFSPVSIIQKKHFHISPDFYTSTLFTTSDNKSPPGSQGISLLILNSIFRI
ncbi:MAG: hypothetical protein H0W12_09080 [Chitinophagaceae bacterium]|nr:hypothetical protein [Chitinophagaceae bacterium]